MSGTVSYTYRESAIPGWPATLQRSTDDAMIPCDLGNVEYQMFLAWVAAGNTPPSGWTGPTNPTGASA